MLTSKLQLYNASSFPSSLYQYPYFPLNQAAPTAPILNSLSMAPAHSPPPPARTSLSTPRCLDLEDRTQSVHTRDSFRLMHY
ncbi:transcription factor SOX-8a [Lates japonicus]|uniref:Transcription factor SOX-8a n=1 Tax=Lates japonicus TaxID=270547 RepID=A0AAD3NBM8_LATJO|nr:transcription factor SOX-8a [Lates japonicus]